MYCGRFNFKYTSSRIFSIEKLQEIICCKTQSEHTFSCKCVWLVMHCLFVFVFSFDIRCQSVNGPTPGDYKLQNPIEHAFIDWRILSKKLCTHVIELIPPPIETMVLKIKEVRRFCGQCIL